MWKKYSYKPKQKLEEEEEEVVEESLAKQINRKLDEILVIKSEINRMRADLAEDKKLFNNKTGEETSVKKIVELADNEITAIKNDLNQITNNGKRVRGLFDNVYYVNDTIQDKLIVENNL